MIPRGFASPSPSNADISELTRRGLVASLFADTRALVQGAIMTAATAFVCAAIERDVLAVYIGLATIAVTIERVRQVHAREARLRKKADPETGRVEQQYVIGAIAYLLCNGALTMWAFASSNDPFVLTITLGVSLTNALSIAVRNFAIRYGVDLQVVAIMLPLVLACALRGGTFWFLAAGLVFLALFIYSSSARLRKILLSEIEYRRRSESVAAQFNFAINNMSHGLCMIASDMRIVVANEKLGQFFGLPPKRKLVGARFDALVRLVVARKLIKKDAASRLLNAFAKLGSLDDLACLQIETAQGGVCDITLKRHPDNGWVLVVEDVTEKKEAQRALHFAARYDPVTNLKNRRSFELALAEDLVAARLGGLRTEVLFLDLDGFKQVNDTLGHKVGDRVLCEAGARLSALMGERDIVARWGGDEFVVMRRAADGLDTVQMAERLIAELSRSLWIDGAEVSVGASVGIAVCEGGELDMDLLLQQADMAVYAAKREARGSYRLYEDAMSERARERRLLELDLQAALASRAFELYYQPVVSLQTRRIVSFEALARWRHPTRGAVSPAVFVPILEDLNLMSAFGSWALQRACQDAVTWPKHLRVAVNVSTKQMETVNECVQRALRVSGLSPSRLELEITETAVLTAGHAAQEVLERLRALGVRIALDDFGTGFSSLSHIIGLPLDKVKIDKSFTQQLGVNRKAELLVESISRLSAQLGMTVTVEGIETVEQLEQSRAMGVITEGQGYLFGKPMPVSALPELFQRDDILHVA